nr:retrovirus-related Pol polyprotein from transposon TNT 1-94 [Tanacetum cinerariifolium]
MGALLIQHGCEAALDVLPADIEAQTKAELNRKAHNAVILCLGNQVLREVTGDTTIARVWSKLETLYMTNSLANKLYLKKKLYTFYMPAGRKIFEHIDEFNKIVLDLVNIEVKFEDEDLDLLLLTCLPASYEHFVDTLLYEWEALTLEDLMATLNSKEIKERSKAKGDDGEGLYVRGRTDRRDSRQSKGSQDRILESGKVKVINGSMVILSGIRRDNYVYSLDGYAMAGELNASVEEKDSLAHVWHKRLGHISEARLQVLENRAVWQEKSRNTTQGVINYVHLDLWGLSQVESLGGKRYFLSIVDDYSRRVWIYILRFKHEAFRKFNEWKQLVENQTGRMVKKLRMDNVLEFCNREFDQLCIESRIARHLTVVGMPQQNKVAERMNRTHMDKVRCLLVQSGLPKTFSSEATCTAAYLINRSPSRAIEKKTPMEMWSGHPSDYEMLRIFCRVTYLHDKQGKLDLKAVKYVLLGYLEGVKGYRLYRLNDESPKIVTSRNVVFNESVMYKDTLKDSGVDQTDQEDSDDEDEGGQAIDQPPNLIDYQLVRDREPRTRTKPLSSKWKDAMKEEMDSLKKNKTWELVDHPSGQKLMSCKWLFKKKEWIKGVQKPRYTARLMARGFTQRVCIDCNKVFFPVVRHTSIWVILALTACKDYELEHLDVKTAFLHENLQEVIYMRQPPGYEQGNKEFDAKELKEGKKILGMEIVRDRSRKILRVSQSGYVSKILNNFRIDNGKSVKMLLGGHFKLSFKDCPVKDCDFERMSKVPYANAIRSLMYLMVCTRPDIAYTVSVVSRYLANPGKKHWEAVKWILKYLRGTANVGLVYGKIMATM